MKKSTMGKIAVIVVIVAFALTYTFSTNFQGNIKRRIYLYKIMWNNNKEMLSASGDVVAVRKIMNDVDILSITKPMLKIAYMNPNNIEDDNYTYLSLKRRWLKLRYQVLPYLSKIDQQCVGDQAYYQKPHITLFSPDVLPNAKQRIQSLLNHEYNFSVADLTKVDVYNVPFNDRETYYIVEIKIPQLRKDLKTLRLRQYAPKHFHITLMKITKNFYGDQCVVRPRAKPGSSP